VSQEDRFARFSGYGYTAPDGTLTRSRQAAIFNGSQTNSDAGTEDVIQFPQSALLAPASGFSFGMWHQPYDVTSSRTLAGQVNIGGLNSRWSIRTTAGGQILIIFYTPNTDTFVGDIIGSQAGVIRYGSANLIGFTYGGGSNNALYINGNIDGSSTTGGSIPGSLTAGAGAANLELGRERNQATGTSIPAFGRSWGAFFFNRILSAGDWTNVYNDRWDLLPKNSDGTVTGLVGWWPLDGDLRDRTLNGLDGKTAASGSGIRFINAIGSGTPAYPTQANWVPKKILTLGDSITSGTNYPGAWRVAAASELAWRHRKPVQWIGLQADPGRIVASASSITSNSCTFTVPTGHGVTAPEFISTVGFTTNVTDVIVTSTTSTTIVAPVTAANGSNGTGTIIVEPAFWTDGTHVSSGISGQTLANISSRVASELAANMPDVVVIQGGINDVVSGGGVTVTSIGTILDSLYSNGLPAQTPVVVCNLETSNTAANVPGINGYNAALPSFLSNYAGSKQRGGIVLCDIASVLSMPGDFQSDFIHPNQAGFEKMGVVIAAKLASVM
jgi:lysophospholipase L1-like esterase